MTSRLPGWYCDWLWTAAQLVFECVSVSVCECVCMDAFMLSVTLSNRKCLMWLSLPVQLSSRLHSWTFLTLSTDSPFLFLTLHPFSFPYVCSLSALAQELWMWSPAACCIADRDDEHTDLSLHIQTQLKEKRRKKETFQLSSPESFLLGLAAD